MTDEETAELDKDLQKEPTDFGYEFPSWTSKTVAFHIEKKLGKTMCDSTALEYMHELDYTQQVPETVQADADPAAQAKFEKDIKKCSSLSSQVPLIVGALFYYGIASRSVCRRIIQRAVLSLFVEQRQRIVLLLR